MPSPKKKRNTIFIVLGIIIAALVSILLFMQIPMFKEQGSEEEGQLDTEAPVISCDIKTKTILPGETISIDKLGIRAKDSSKIESLAFAKISSEHFYTGFPEEDIAEMRAAYEKGIDFFGEEFQFAYGGIYSLTIEACDSFQNRSEFTLTIKVEEPPIIEVSSDFYIVEGSTIDFAEYVTAWDFIDEDFSMEDVQIDSTSVNLSKTGTYPITFAGTDNYGLTATVTSTVHILSKYDLQKLINTHQINSSEHTIVGAYNNYDIGYFENEEFHTVQEAMLPTVVHVENPRENIYGSGFIVCMDEKAVTLCTSAYITTNCITPKITFTDGTTCFGTLVKHDEESDVAFIQIPIDGSSEESSLSSESVKNLRTVHINEAYWKDLPNQSGIPLSYICISNDGNTWNSSTGTLQEKDVKRNLDRYEDVHQMFISMDSAPGSSGSAIFDETGRLLGMVRGHSNEEDGSVIKIGVPLSQILRLYEWTFKEKLQYQ